jgi:ribosomal-protein-alanine N-acetyltransferase
MTPERAQALNTSVVTARLVLEPLTAAHAELFFAPLQDQRIYRWISPVAPATVEGLRARYAVRASRLSPGGDQAWLNWAVRRSGDGTYLGKCDAEVDDTNVAPNVGYLFFPAFWGQGYATEAVRGIVAHLARLGITQWRALVTRGNDASARVLAKAGFVFTRTIPDNDTIRGVKYDDLEYVRRSMAAEDPR